VIRISSEYTSEFHFIHDSSMNVGDRPPECIEPFICPQEAMNTLISSGTKHQATFDLVGRFTAQLDTVSDVEKIGNMNTMFIVGVSREGRSPKESKVFKIFSDVNKAFACRDEQNEDYHTFEVFSFDCEITNKFQNMEEVSKVWELYQ